MRKFAAAIAGAALAIGLAMSPAQAAPGGLTPLKSVTAQDGLVQKTHGWHSHCTTDRRGWYHRHSDRRGVVSCGRHVRPRDWRGNRHCYWNHRGIRVCVRR